MAETWSPAVIDDRRRMIFGPRLGRLYLTTTERAADRAFLSVIGLRDAPSAALADPVRDIAFTKMDFRDAAPAKAPWTLCFGYRAVHVLRRLLPLRLTYRMAALFARRGRAGSHPSDDHRAMARTLHAVECRLGFADCYPRAVMTAFLALRSGKDCAVVIGVLAPTPKMHAWCAVAGLLPYEPSPEHYLYQPLWQISLAA